MRITVLIYFFSFIIFYSGTSTAGDWATSEGSCYGKGSKNISLGMTLGHIGFFGAFDYGFHDAISGGVASGFNGYTPRVSNNRENYVPIVVRAAFHPLNLRVLSEKIKERLRKKLDVFVGLSTGWRIGWGERDLGGFFIREHIGIRFYPKENFFLLAEEGSGLGALNVGIGFAF